MRPLRTVVDVSVLLIVILFIRFHSFIWPLVINKDSKNLLEILTRKSHMFVPRNADGVHLPLQTLTIQWVIAMFMQSSDGENETVRPHALKQ